MWFPHSSDYCLNCLGVMDLGQIPQSLAGATQNSDISVATNDELRVLFENDPGVCFIERTFYWNLPVHAQLRTRLHNGHTPCQIWAMEAQDNLETQPGNCMPLSVNRACLMATTTPCFLHHQTPSYSWRPPWLIDTDAYILHCAYDWTAVISFKNTLTNEENTSQ